MTIINNESEGVYTADRKADICLLVEECLDEHATVFDNDGFQIPADELLRELYAENR